jgi:hypothetical protein
VARPLLCHVNRAEAATLSGGSFQASWPRENMQTTILNQVAETTDTAEASTTVTADLGAAFPIRVATVTGLNWTAAATLELRGAATEGGLASAPPVEIEQAVWLGGNSPATTSQYRPTALIVLPADAEWRWWRLSAADVANPAGFLDWGYLGLWEALELPGPAFGASLAPETGTIRQETIGLVAKFDRRPSRRTTRFTLDGLDRATADRLLDLVLERDLDRPLFWIPDPEPDDPGRLLRRSFLARARTLTALEQPWTRHERAGFELEEIVGG